MDMDEWKTCHAGSAVGSVAEQLSQLQLEDEFVRKRKELMLKKEESGETRSAINQMNEGIKQLQVYLELPMVVEQLKESKSISTAVAEQKLRLEELVQSKQSLLMKLDIEYEAMKKDYLAAVDHVITTTNNDRDVGNI